MSATEVDLLPGEISVARASKAHQLLLCTDAASRSVSGMLLCTNYRFCFIPAADSAVQVTELDASVLAASKTVPLGCIKEVSIVTGARSRKTLDSNSTLPKKIVEFELVCKDLRRLVFNVKHCAKSDASSIINALARHTHPSSVHLLFSFDYTRALKYSRTRKDSTSGDSQAPSFLNPSDWQKELHRLGITGDQWRVTEVNKRFHLCETLCPYFVCPTTVSDNMLEYAASLHQRNRLPVWCWSHPHTGVSLTRGAVTEIDDESEAPDPNYVYAIAMARHIDHQVESKKMQKYDIVKKCGTVKDVHTGFSKLQELCMPSSPAELSSLDRKWLAGLDASGWPGLVRNCLLLAKDVAHSLCVKRRCAMLLEDDGRDLSCVVSSLAQLMVDPHFRSIPGFEALLQKEWVAMGHPFTTRHGLIKESLSYGSEEQLLEGPVFLLFLDCVWQLVQQFPSVFEFSESYLLRLHDLVHCCCYGNFLFDSPKRRVQASIHSRRNSFFSNGDETLDSLDEYEGPLLSAWGRWRNTLSQEENEQCLNPLYYIFGSSDAHYDYTNPLLSQAPMDSLDRIFSSVPSSPSLSIDSSKVTSPTSPRRSRNDVRDFYQMGLLLPETSMCSIKIWSAFFSRYIPELRASQQQRLLVQHLESRLVRDVRKLKDALNELELSQGTFTSDLTSFIGEILEAKEKERQKERKSAVITNVPSKPRLSAIIYPYEQVNGEAGDDIDRSQKSRTAPIRMTSLAQFTDALYSSEMEDGSSPRPRANTDRCSSPGGAVGRSPVTKTRLRVTRKESTDPVKMALRWQSVPAYQERHSPLITDRILSRKDSGVIEGAEELIEL